MVPGSFHGLRRRSVAAAGNDPILAESVPDGIEEPQHDES